MIASVKEKYEFIEIISKFRVISDKKGLFFYFAKFLTIITHFWIKMCAEHSSFEWALSRCSKLPGWKLIVLGVESFRKSLSRALESRSAALATGRLRSVKLRRALVDGLHSSRAVGWSAAEKFSSGIGDERTNSIGSSPNQGPGTKRTQRRAETYDHTNSRNSWESSRSQPLTNRRSCKLFRMPLEILNDNFSQSKRAITIIIETRILAGSLTTNHKSKSSFSTEISIAERW